jgi:Papain family cysteine protease/Domain of unknown function (DUF4384)
MRHVIHCLGCILSLSIGGVALADQDPPHKHYATSRVPADPALEQAPRVGHYRDWLRQTVDLTRLMPPVGDQGDLGSGIAWAIAYAARSYYTGRNENRDIESPRNEASPSYVYSMALKGDCNDGGANISETIEVLRKGALSLEAFPYKAECMPAPSASEVASAKDFRVKGYQVLDHKRIDDVKGQLQHSNPVIALFRASAAFEDFRGTGVFAEDDGDAGPQSGEDRSQPLVIVGYDDEKQAVRVMNSWGRGWGDQGRAWISYKDLTSRSSGAIVLEVGATATQDDDRQRTEDKVEPQEKYSEGDKQEPWKLAENCGNFDDDSGHGNGDCKKEDHKPPPQPTLPDLHNLSCGRIHEAHQQGRVTLDGFVASDADLALVREVAKNQPNITVGQITVAPWPLCEAMDTLEKPLKEASLRPSLATSLQGIGRAGETLRVDLKSPSRPSYVYLSYIQADGTVITLTQPQGKILSQTQARSSFVFGDGAPGHGKFTIGEPYGYEMIVAITSASPLFDNSLPEQLSERDFLSALRKALLYKPAASMPDREVSAAIQVLKTQPN